MQSPSGDLQAIVKTVKDIKGEEKQYVEVSVGLISHIDQEVYLNLNSFLFKIDLSL